MLVARARGSVLGHQSSVWRRSQKTGAGRREAENRRVESKARGAYRRIICGEGKIRAARLRLCRARAVSSFPVDIIGIFRSLIHGKINGHGRALAELACNRDLSAVGLDDFLANDQTQSGSLAGGFCGNE